MKKLTTELDRPPVVILNMLYSGLGIARDLAKRGVRVAGISSDRSACGNYTRWCEVRLGPSSRDNPEELKSFLLDAVGELHGAVIFPTGDADVVFLDRFRYELERHYRLAIPPRSSLEQVIHKGALVRVASRARVPVPRTAVIRTKDDLRRAAAEVGFPSVLKPVSSIHWRQRRAGAVLGDRKALRIANLEQLQHEYVRLAGLHPEMLVQEWIPGGADGLVIFGGYAGENSEALGWFTARKLLQFPDDLGTGCVVESVEIPELRELTERLWRSLDHHGMAEVEYKRDPETGEFKLIEMNARHWDWHQLGHATGLNLTWIAYSHLVGQPAASERRPPAKATRWIAEESLLRSFVHRQVSFRNLRAALRGHRMYGIFAWDDPLPFLSYALRTVPLALARKTASRLWPRHSTRAPQATTCRFPNVVVHSD